MSPTPFDVSLDDRGQVAVLHVQGEVDTATAPRMGKAIEAQMERKRRVVLDVSKVEFMDLHGLAVLMRATRRARQEGGTFALERPSPCVKRLLELVHAEKDIEILPDDSDPLAAA